MTTNVWITLSGATLLLLSLQNVTRSQARLIHFTVTKLIKVGQRPISIGGALWCWAASPAGDPENCGLRIIVTPLFPK
jgi:hypothetical protein